MNKIILQIGLLVFFFSVIYFVQRGAELEKIIINSLAIFIILTVMLSIITLGLIKAINKNTIDKINNYSNDFTGTSEHE
ncbi:hypothetical protein [Rosettibacter firmus]|uniref:hypothetical protein n=1 Tax=Rosettibacter firmus TaxID=3111522 RepID=UPI00336C03FA